MASWGYVVAGFAVAAGVVAAYAWWLERRIARLRRSRRGAVGR